MEVTVNGCKVMLNDIGSIKEWKEKTESEIHRLEIQISDKKEILNDIYKYLYTHCKHEIVNDYVDQMEGYKLSIPIKYCTKCNLTFNRKY